MTKVVLTAIIALPVLAAVISPSLALATPCKRPDYPVPAAKVALKCSDLRSLDEALCRSDFMDIVDGQITEEQRSLLECDVATWTADEKPITLVFYIHGGLVDAQTGLKGALSIDKVFRNDAFYGGAEVVPFYFIYHVGAEESIIKGDRERGLFHLQDNASTAVLDRFTTPAQLDADRVDEARDHGDMTRREDWMRAGLPPMSIAGKNGATAWAYMKQSILDGLDTTSNLTTSSEAADIDPASLPPDVDRYPTDGPCSRPTRNEVDPWPHLLRGSYRWQDAGARDLLCQVGTMINVRSQRGLRTTIVTVGHSTGSIYVTQLIRKANQLWVSGAAATQQFHVIFLAPAVSYEDFDQLLAQAPNRIAELRIFTMDDRHEQQDKVLASTVGVFMRPLANYYERSLLYAVSGIFEPNADEPILGLERFANASILTEMERCAPHDSVAQEGLAEVTRVRWFMDQRLGGLKSVFVLSPSPAEARPPFISRALDHGEFPNDPDTRASLAELVRESALALPWMAPIGGSVRNEELYRALEPAGATGCQPRPSAGAPAALHTKQSR